MWRATAWTIRGRCRGGPVRECGPEVWHGAGGAEGCDLQHRAELVPVPHRSPGRGQDHAAAPALPLHEADAGLITMFGRDVSSLDPDEVAVIRRRIGIVFQDFRLLDHFTTYENVALPLRVLGKEEASYRAEVTELCMGVASATGCTCCPPVLSGGEKQRAGHRPRPHRPAGIPAGGRAHRQCGPDAGPPPAAPFRGTEPLRHLGSARHPRHRAHGSVRRAPLVIADGRLYVYD